MLEVFDVFFHPWVQLLHQLPSLAKFGIQTQPMRRIALHLGQRCTALTFQYPIATDVATGHRVSTVLFIGEVTRLIVKLHPKSKGQQVPKPSRVHGVDES